MQTLNDEVGSAMARLNIGNALRAAGNRPAAVEHYMRALSMFDLTDDRWGRANCLHGLGLALADTDPDAAPPQLRRAQSLFEAIGDLPGQHDNHLALARCLDRTNPQLAAHHRQLAAHLTTTTTPATD